MKIIRVKKMPFGIGLMLFPFIFVSTEGRKENKIQVTINHEKIHYEQAKELWIVGFYVLILLEYITKGYRHGRLETECYGNQNNLNYLKTRKKYAWK